MAKLQDLFTQARRPLSGNSIGFLGKSRSESKAHAASLVVEFPHSTQGQTPGALEAALKAGADGLLFSWDGQEGAALENLKSEIETAKASKDQLVTGLRITGGWDKLDRETFTQIKEQGIQYIILPLEAPARLLAVEEKDLEKVVTVPMRSGEMYPIFIRNLTAFENVSAVLLDFEMGAHIGSMSIEDVLQYRAVREAVRFPAFFNVQKQLSEEDAYTITTLGIQAVILQAAATEETTRKQVKALRTVLEKIQKDKEEREKDSSALIK